MLIDHERQRIVCLSQDPKTIFSYGLQVNELIKGLTDYQFHIISSQYAYGRPYESDGYITWAFEGEQQRTTTTLKKIVDYTNPVCVFSMGDIHHHPNVSMGKPLQVPWVSWFPWDNHDMPGLLRAKQHIEEPDIKVTMSDFAFDLMKQCGIEVDEVIYNIVNTDTFYPMSREEMDRETLVKMNPAIADKKILLFVGRPSWRKNLEFLMGAFKEICRQRDDVLLYLHVDFDDEGAEERPNMDKLTHALQLNDKIINTEKNKWTTGIGANYLNRLYNLCDLYVTPHGGEGFGLPICEAMATGIPFVATNCTTMPEFAGDEERGLLANVRLNHLERGIYRPWVDIKDFTDKILYLLDNDDERNKMGRAGMKWVHENCSHKVIVPQWKNLFEKLNVPLCNVDRNSMIIDWRDNL